MARSRIRRAAVAAILLGISPVACGHEELDCAEGFSILCLPDGETCTCSPSCFGATGCNPYSICTNGACHECALGDNAAQGAACICMTNIELCAPAYWAPGQQIAFVGPNGPGSPIPDSAPPRHVAPNANAADTNGAGAFSCPREGGETCD